MKKSDVKIGDRLTITYPMGAEFVGTCSSVGCDFCNHITEYPLYRHIEPGMVGVVARVDIPAVTRNKSFLCFDFTIEGHVYRLRPWYDEVKIPRN
jgi:hypothetical protein